MDTEEKPATTSQMESAGSAIANRGRLSSNVPECFICMGPPSDPVAGRCGHVFCWPCMHRWLLQDLPKPCPVCRHPLLRDRDIIPLSCTGGDDSSNGQESLRESDIPPRPRNPLLVDEESEETERSASGSRDGDSVVPALVAYHRRFQQLSRELSEERARVRQLTETRDNLELLQQLSHELSEERARVRQLTEARGNLELLQYDWEQQNSSLRVQIQQADRLTMVAHQQRERQWLVRQRMEQLATEWEELNSKLEEEAKASVQRCEVLVARENEMGARLASLEMQVARAESNPRELIQMKACLRE